MTEDQPNQEDTRSRQRRQQPKIGGISQYATIGGSKRPAPEETRTQTSERLDVEDAKRIREQEEEQEEDKRLDVQTAGSTNVEDVRTIKRSGVRAFEVSNVETSETPNAQTPEQSSVQSAKLLNVQTVTHPEVESVKDLERPGVQIARVSNVEATGSSNVQTSGELVAQTPKKEERIRQTVYLELELDEWVRDHANRERKRLKRRVEISEVVNAALRLMRDGSSH